jgi:hypothetical protein
MIAAI